MIKVYGASDDLIEIEGDVREEFQYADGDLNYLFFDTGLVVKVFYDGDWYFKTVIPSIKESYLLTEHEYNDYSELLVVTDAKWVGHGIDFAK